MTKIIKIFYDTETTGLNANRHSIHQLSGLVEVNGEVIEEFDFKVRPNPKAIIEPGALAHCHVTEEQILAYPEMLIAYKAFIKMLSKYIDKLNPKQKAYLVGFNNRRFDDGFLRSFFAQNGDTYFDSWFWSDTLDALVLAGQYLINRRAFMPSFKLHRVALTLGLDVDKDKLHDATYDVLLTRQIYRIVCGYEAEDMDIF